MPREFFISNAIFSLTFVHGCVYRNIPFFLRVPKVFISRAVDRTLIGGGGGEGVYLYIHVLPDEFRFKSNSN